MMQCWISHCRFFFSKARLLTPTCCNKPRILLLWEHAETWCDQTPAWCRRSPCSGSPSPGLRRTWQRQRAWPTERWPQQTPGPPECPQPSVKERKEQSKEEFPPVALFHASSRWFTLTTTTSSLRNPRTFPEAYWIEKPVPFSTWVCDLEASYLLWVTESPQIKWGLWKQLSV